MNSLAFITGASSGLGEQFAHQLAAKGHRLVVTARRTDRLEALRDRIEREHGVRVDILSADLGNPEGIATVASAIRETQPDILVNNAGFGTSGDFADSDPEREATEITVNVTAVQQLSRAALTHMKANRSGAILNVASLGALQPVPSLATYAATKSFVLSFSCAIREELLPYNIAVTALCPGPVETEFFEVSGSNPGGFDAIVLQADRVVADGLAGLAKNRAVVVPGLPGKLSASMTSALPAQITTKLAKLAFSQTQ